MPLYFGLLFLCFTPIIVFILVFFIALLIGRSKYCKSVYYQNTHKGFFQVRYDKGAYGEYLTYKYLSRLNPPGNFLFNVYLPKGNGETTEIDVILIHQSGLYVFESKNYSGWIFGSEMQQKWAQTLPSGKKSVKSYFFNPIMQNELHIKWLRNVLADDATVPIYSYILFSDRCTLKNIQLTSDRARVIHRYEVYAEVNRCAQQRGTILSIQQINSIVNRLLPYTQVTEELKQQHIDKIKLNHDKAITQCEGSANLEKSVKSELSVSSTARVCPRCGKPLNVRTAKKGSQTGKQFWGCTGYPVCRYLENV
jgi:Zn-finger domain associated with topoisomerase type I